MKYLDEIRQHSQALRKLNDIYSHNYQPLKVLDKLSRTIANIIFTGMGSSLFVGYVACEHLSKQGIMCTCIESNEFKKQWLNILTHKSLVVAISQSGESEEILSLCKQIGTAAPIVVVTNNLQSSLAKYGIAKFEIFAGKEETTASKTYTNTLAVLVYISRRFAGLGNENTPCDIERLAAVIDNCLKNDARAKEFARFLQNATYICVVGSGASYCSASHSQLVVEEAGKMFSTRYTTGQFIHGPIELIRDNFYSVVFDTNEKYRIEVDRIVENIREFGGKVALITNRKIEPAENMFIYYIAVKNEMLAPIAEIVPLEMMIYELGMERGINPGVIYRVKK